MKTKDYVKHFFKTLGLGLIVYCGVYVLTGIPGLSTVVMASVGGVYNYFVSTRRTK